MDGDGARGIDVVVAQQIAARRLRNADDGVGHGDLARHLPVQVLQRLLLQQLGEAFERQIVDGDDALARHAPNAAAAESSSRAKKTSHPASSIQATYAAAVSGRSRRAERHARAGRTMQSCAFAGRSAWSDGPRSVTRASPKRTSSTSSRFGQLVQQVVEVPADAGQRLVERPDVDADAQRPLAMRRRAPRAPQTGDERMA